MVPCADGLRFRDGSGGELCSAYCSRPLGTRTALLVSGIGGLMSGLGQVALLDLVIRSCPRGFEETGIMLATAASCSR
jgi:hypothetical protein